MGKNNETFLQRSKEQFQQSKIFNIFSLVNYNFKNPTFFVFQRSKAGNQQINYLHFIRGPSRKSGSLEIEAQKAKRLTSIPVKTDPLACV